MVQKMPPSRFFNTFERCEKPLVNPFYPNSVYLILSMRSLRSILSLAFAFLVLFSSTSFMVGMHRCGGQVKNVALFTKAEGCAQEAQIPPCHRLDTPPCCQDVTIVHEHQDFKGEITHLEFSASPLTDVLTPAVVLAEVIPSAGERTYARPYDPPLRSYDRIVSLQVFLI
jgi:hypothetical protein